MCKNIIWFILFIIIILLGCVRPKQILINVTGIPVLMYHLVVKDDEKTTFYPTNENVMTVKQFTEHMEYLHDNEYYTLTMDEFYCYMINMCTVPEKSVLITIDDGYQSVYRYILPVLRQFHFNAVSFVVTSRVDEISKPWSVDPRAFMGWDQINKARKNYPHLEFHSHSHDQHRIIEGVKIPSIIEYTNALTDVQTASVLLGSDVYAYPFGHVTETIVRALQESGYRMAFGIGEGVHAQLGTDLYRIPRYAMKSSTTFHDFKQLLGNTN